MTVAGIAVAAAIATIASTVTSAHASDPPCQHVPPSTVSPKHYRLWTAAPSTRWAAGADQQNPDGSLRLKAPWFAAGPKGNARRGPTGPLDITGTRLDAVAPRAKAQTRQIGVVGFGGSAAWSAVITFPTEGCWRIVGTVGRTRHTFRLLVTREPPGMAPERVAR